MTNLYINEHLTKQRKDLFYAARTVKRENKYEYLWTANGKVFMKKSNVHARIAIKSMSDLEKLK